FKNHPLGHNILGTSESLQAFTKADIRSFLNENYAPQNMVIGITANKSPKQIKTLLEKYFEHLEPKTTKPKKRVALKNNSIHHAERNPSSQVHYMIGATTYDLYRPLTSALLHPDHLLGGMGMSSRLNLEIREKH